MTNLSPYPSSTHKNNTPLTPIGSGSNIPRSGNLNINSYVTSGNHTTDTGNKKRNLFSGSSNTNSNNPVSSREVYSDEKKANQLENILIWRKLLIYYHYYCLEIFLSFSTITSLTNKPEGIGKLLLSLALFVKNRSTFCMSIVAIHTK